MKKPLYPVASTTSAIALSTAFAAISISQSSAAEFNMEVGGYYELQIGASATDAKFYSNSPGGIAPSGVASDPRNVNMIDPRTGAPTPTNRHAYRTRRTLTLQEAPGLNPQPASGSTMGYTNCYRPATEGELERGSPSIVFDYTATSTQNLQDCYASGEEFYRPSGLEGVDVKRDAEIHFNPSVTLDNGIRIGATVELEAHSAGDQIDEAYLSIDGKFGRVVIGSENSARYLMHYAAPDVTFFGANSGDVTSYIPLSGDIGLFNDLTRQEEELAGTFSSQRADAFTLIGLPQLTNSQQLCESSRGEQPRLNAMNQCIVNLPLWDDLGARLGHNFFRATLGSTYIENMANNDVERITWFSPRFSSGIQFGVSYARDGGEDSNDQVDINGEDLVHITDIGLNYVGTIGPVDLAVSGGYGIAFTDGEEDFVPESSTVGGTTVFGTPEATRSSSNPQVFNFGLNLSWEGWTIGGSFAEQNGTGEFHGARMDGTAYDAGVSYETGPWGFSFTYFHGENVDNEYNPQGEFSIRSRNDLGLVQLLELRGDASYIVGQGGVDEEHSLFLVGLNYNLAKGVRLNAFGAYSLFQENSNDEGEAERTKVDGFVIGTGIRLDY